ncbi:TetR family transcriptional regulator [Chitinimonas sp. BJYL2]|uniref:TetR family transcriptional regulator n=1 Tax=Chitinimonas sp. BJYL2 TaxID=2976696 RepID=UPI0022B4C5D3|nr:TetR family transcriptional regulator [Chitinimonas sp. BJYL2]
MARRTKEQAAETREQLLDAAEAVFLRKGVGKTTLDDIAREANLTRGAVYWHFKDKGDLFAAMCDRVSLPMQAMLETLAAAPGPDPLGRLRDDGANILRQVGSDSHTQRVFEIMMFRVELNDTVQNVMAAEQQRGEHCRSQLASVLRVAQELGQLPPHLNTCLAAFALNSFLVGCIHEWLEHREFDLAEQADWLMETFFVGLRNAPPMPVAGAGCKAMPQG